MLKTTVILFLLLSLFSPATGRQMRWIPNVDMDNPDNWDPRGVPCRNDHVIFPAKAPPVYVQKNQTLMELVLPNDGEIILAEGSILTFPEATDSSCIGKTVRFTDVNPKSWFDPVNWCVTSESSVDCLTTQPDLLDTERIPCLSDNVVFADGTSFFVDLRSDAEIRISSLRMGSEQMNTDTFRSYLGSESGRKQFVGQNSSNAKPTTVTIGGSSVCTDVTGCACGNMNGSNRICASESINCAQVVCITAIQPDGHCCAICGTLLDMDHGAGFKLTNLRNLVTDTFRRLNVDPDGVKTIISKMDNDRIQIVLEPATDEGLAEVARVGSSLKEDLDRDPRYGAIRVNLYSSQSSRGAHTGEESSQKMSSGGIVGVIFAILLIVIFLLVAVYFYRNRGNCNRPRLPEITLPSPPDFRRFFRPGSDRGSEAEFELHQQSVSFDNRIFEGNLAGFENPTYGDLFQSLQSESMAQTTGPEKGGFSNPMYPTTQPSVESKDSPPDYILYDVPPKEPSRKEAKTKSEAEQGKGSGTGAKEGSDEPQSRSDTLSKILTSPFRMMTSRLRRARPEKDEVPAESKDEDAPREETETEAEKRRVKGRFGRSKDHERLEETGEGDGGEEDEREEEKAEKAEKAEKRVVEEAAAGFGNPLYGDEDLGAVVDKDLGEAGTTGSGSAAADRNRRRRAGFENPLFEESKEKLQKSDEGRSVFVAGAKEAEDESRA